MKINTIRIAIFATVLTAGVASASIMSGHDNMTAIDNHSAVTAKTLLPLSVQIQEIGAVSDQAGEFKSVRSEFNFGWSWSWKKWNWDWFMNAISGDEA